MSTETEKSKKELLQDLVTAGVIAKAEDWENLNIKQIQTLLDFAKPELSEEDKKQLVENFNLSEEEKQVLEDKFYKELVEKYESENPTDDVYANEIVRRRKAEQENTQLKKSIKTLS